ncbi:uncharacterized protein H6S33_010549 [Morchella sextelata]|uniref:uncharacterized protein n=1 Tax=Morchella sextelata TaxID=1174677 RepID=UPI001D051101|nr:uncharacterized protein H6S33_010549 [Morchella sextelata]KAH0611284.1 hypothetical protein H6S33_010549 [Morchella sextelata]
MPSFEDLPFEILSQILTLAAELNVNEEPTYTYGLTQAPRSNQRHPLQRYVRGRVPTDVLRWNTVNSYRLVNSRWHHWALSYALKDVYVRRWRGGEQWGKESFREADKSSQTPGFAPAVFQDPYKSIKSTAKLFTDYPQITAHIRRLWFNGIYQHDTNKYIFQILHNAVNARNVVVPWTTLRFGTEAEWQRLMSFPRLTSLELLTIGLRESSVTNPANNTDHAVLRTGNGLNFSGLKRFKIFGDSNLNPITDEDLYYISRTATNLEEIHITGASSITIKGVAALVASSFQTLKLLEFTPLSDEGFSHPSSDAVHPHLHICSLIASCPRLKDLAITVPACCPEMFSRPSVAWQETARIRVAGRGNCNPAGLPLDMNIEGFIHTLESARDLVSPAARKGRGELDIEIAVANWLFDVKTGFVHGNFLEAKKASEMVWAPEEFPTTKGPYGHTGLYGDVEDVKGEWSCVPSRDFFEAMRWGLVRFDN